MRGSNANISSSLFISRCEEVVGLCILPSKILSDSLGTCEHFIRNAVEVKKKPITIFDRLSLLTFVPHSKFRFRRSIEDFYLDGLNGENSNANVRRGDLRKPDLHFLFLLVCPN